MNRILAVAIGGAAGSVARYLTQLWCVRLLGAAFRWGALAVNVGIFSAIALARGAFT